MDKNSRQQNDDPEHPGLPIENEDDEYSAARNRDESDTLQASRKRSSDEDADQGGLNSPGREDQDEDDEDI